MDDKYKYLEELTKFFQLEYTHDELVRLLKKIEKLNTSSGESQENDDIKDAITDKLPYMETIGGYNYLFACGCAINAYMREDNVVVDFVFASGRKVESGQYASVIKLTREKAARTIIVGGYGIKDNIKRDLPSTYIKAKDVKLYAIYGGSCFNGTIGESNIVLDNSEIDVICTGGFGTVDYKKNTVYKSTITINGGRYNKIYNGPASAFSRIVDSKVILNNGYIETLYGSGVGGNTINSHIIINNGTVDQYNNFYGENFSNLFVDSIKFTLNNGTVNKFSLGAQGKKVKLQDYSDECYLELLGGQILAVDTLTGHSGYKGVIRRTTLSTTTNLASKLEQINEATIEYATKNDVMLLEREIEQLQAIIDNIQQVEVPEYIVANKNDGQELLFLQEKTQDENVIGIIIDPYIRKVKKEVPLNANNTIIDEFYSFEYDIELVNNRVKEIRKVIVTLKEESLNINTTWNCVHNGKLYSGEHNLESCLRSTYNDIVSKETIDEIIQQYQQDSIKIQVDFVIYAILDDFEQLEIEYSTDIYYKS